MAVQARQYYPSSTLTIDSGDTVTWSFPAGEPNTVSLLKVGQSALPPPSSPTVSQPAAGTTYDGTTFTSSGFKLLGGTYSLRFVKPGTYKVYCLARELPVSGGQPAFGREARSGLVAGAPAPTSIMRFLATSDVTATTTVPVGSTVTWTNLSNNSPHTVTFAPVGQPFPSLNPFGPPAGGNVYGGTTLVNSGPLFPGQSFAITFPTAGTYQYHCIFHDDTENMISTLIVR